MEMRIILTLLAASLGGIAACNTDEPLCAGTEVFDEPILRIVSVTDVTSGAIVSPVRLSDFEKGGASYTPSFFIGGPGLVNAAVVDGQVICNVSCAFGYEDGTLGFTVQAAGYAPMRVSVDLKYATVTGKCERHASGPIELRISLNRS